MAPKLLHLSILLLGLISTELVTFAKTGHYRPDQILLLPKKDAPVQSLAAFHSDNHRKVLRSYPSLGGLQLVKLSPGEDVEETIKQFRASGLVEFAEPDYKLATFLTPDDPHFLNGNQWALRNSGVPGADIQAMDGWETMRFASNIVVAVVDTGIQYDHPDLRDNLWVNPGEIPGNNLDDDRNGYVDDVHGINAVNGSGNPLDGDGHGTHVAGIIGAAANNGIGVAGVAWKVQLMACKFISAGSGDTSDAIECIDYARRKGAHIINASWGGSDYSSALSLAVSNARAAGIIIVAAAGNEAQNLDVVPLYPAAFDHDNIVSVCGLNRSGLFESSYSSYSSSKVDLGAPASSIYSTWINGSYRSSTGTSMAAPFVSGALALLKARFPADNDQQLIQRLFAAVDPSPSLEGKCVTGGRLNLAKALGPNPAAEFTADRWSGEPPLPVKFTNTSFGELRNVSWNFGDGSPGSTENHPSHVFNYPGQFQVQLTVTGSNGRTNIYERTVVVAAGYEVIPEKFNWIDPSQMTRLHLSDNGVSGPHPLPFPFSFYLERRSEVYVGANGILGFERTGLETTSNTSIPSTQTPNTILCPYWDNLNPAAGGAIYLGTLGEPPDRRFVVSWVGVPRNSSPITLTFQAVLEERTGHLIFQYLDVAPESNRGGAKRATVGIESGDGTRGTLHTYNGSPLVLQNLSAIRFKPKEISWLELVRTEPLRFEVDGTGHITSKNNLIKLSNHGNAPASWQLESSVPWLSMAPAEGILSPGAITDLQIDLNDTAKSLMSGSHQAELFLRNLTDGGGNRSISVSLEKAAALPAFSVTGETTPSFKGGLGGPFTPASYLYILRNNGRAPLEWTSLTDSPWLELRPSSGLLDPGQQLEVQLLLQEETITYGSGSYLSQLEFRSQDGIPTASIEANLIISAEITPASAALVDGQFRGSLQVPQAGEYLLETSTDMVEWVVVAQLRSEHGRILFTHEVTAAEARYFRARGL